MEIWIIEGMGDDNPRKYKPTSTETIGELKQNIAKKLSVSASQVDATTDTKKLTDDKALIVDVVKKGEVIHIIPRARAGF